MEARNNFFRAIVLGLYLVASTMVLFSIAHDTTILTVFGLKQLTVPELRGMVYMQVSISGAALIFVTRSHRWSLLERPGWFLLGAFVFSQVIATLIGIFGFNGYPTETPFEGCGWAYAILIWLWCIFWYLPMDLLKLGTGFVANKFYAWKRAHSKNREGHESQQPLLKGQKGSRRDASNNEQSTAPLMPTV